MRGLTAHAAWLGWAGAAAAMVLGWVLYGWPGVVLALTVTVFWLLLQFSRALRVMRMAAGRPVGHVDSALMLHARLHASMPLAQIIKLTRSLGQQRADEPDTFVWRDAAGDALHVEMQAGRLLRWSLQRAVHAEQEPQGPQTAPAPESPA